MDLNWLLVKGKLVFEEVKGGESLGEQLVLVRVRSFHWAKSRHAAVGSAACAEVVCLVVFAETS
jgi:hypothetical protein